MLAVYQELIDIAQQEYNDIILSTALIGGSPASPNKLRLIIRDGSFLDVWLSDEGDYASHWEQRKQRGKFYRWDNAPHHPHVSTFPKHFHDGDETSITESQLNPDPISALHEVLKFLRQNLSPD